MPSPAHTKIVVTGSLPGGEIFTFGWAYRGAAGNQATLDAEVAAVYDKVATPGATATTLRSLLAPSSSYQKITGYSYQANATAADLVSERAWAAAGTGGGLHPNQVALVATLRTALAGRRNRGRIYLCATGAELAANGQLTSPTATEVATAVVDMFAVSDIPPGPIVISRVAGTAQDVDRVSVDSRMDIIRGRASSEAPTSVATVNI